MSKVTNLIKAAWAIWIKAEGAMGWTTWAAEAERGIAWKAAEKRRQKRKLDD